MYDHIGLKTPDLEASLSFYRPTLAALGYELCWQDDSGAGFGPNGAPAFWLYRDESAGNSGSHIAFRAAGRAAVAAFHKAGLKAGGKDNGAPGLRTDYAADYYAAFLLDPDGNNLEAVCFN